MKGRHGKSSWNNALSLTPKKKEMNVLTVRDTFGSQGISQARMHSLVAVILDTRYYVTLDTLLEEYPDRFLMIYIIQMDPDEYRAMDRELERKQCSLGGSKYEHAKVLPGDVFDFLRVYKGRIDYAWLDMTCIIPKGHELDSIVRKLPGLTCLAITISCHGNSADGGISVDERVALMHSMFEAYLPYKLLTLGYSCGGGPMHMVAFGRTYAKCIDKKSLAVTHKVLRVARKSRNLDEYAEDSFCDLSSSSDVEEPSAKKSKRTCVDSVRNLGRSYRMQ